MPDSDKYRPGLRNEFRNPAANRAGVGGPGKRRFRTGELKKPTPGTEDFRKYRTGANLNQQAQELYKQKADTNSETNSRGPLQKPQQPQQRFYHGGSNLNQQAQGFYNKFAGAKKTPTPTPKQGAAKRRLDRERRNQGA